MEIWRKFGFGLALPIFSIAFAYLVFDHRLTGADVATWVQAFGAGGAVFAAFWVGNGQARREERARLDALKAERLMGGEIIRMFGEQTRIAMTSAKNHVGKHSLIPYRIASANEIIDLARNFQAFRLSDQFLVLEYMNALNRYSIFIETMNEFHRRNEAGAALEEDWVAYIKAIGSHRTHIKTIRLRYEGLLHHYYADYRRLSSPIDADA